MYVLGWGHLLSRADTNPGDPALGEWVQSHRGCAAWLVDIQRQATWPGSMKGVSSVTDQPLTTGDLIDAVVTRVSPFGVHVESVSGIPGLVTGSDAAEGTVLHLRVVTFDAELQRFNGELV